jgi:hypothetical protein
MDAKVKFPRSRVKKRKIGILISVTIKTGKLIGSFFLLNKTRLKKFLLNSLKLSHLLNLLHPYKLINFHNQEMSSKLSTNYAKNKLFASSMSTLAKDYYKISCVGFSQSKLISKFLSVG